MSTLCELEEKHGVDLGAGYKNNQACAVFVDGIHALDISYIILLIIVISDLLVHITILYIIKIIMCCICIS